MRVRSRIYLMMLAGVTLLASACSDMLVPLPVATVEVVPGARVLLVGDTLTMAARARAADGTPLDAGPTKWTSSDASVVALTGTGRIAARAPGRATIRAEIAGRIGTAEIVVNPAPIATLEISPPGLTLVEGTAERLSAIARDAAGLPVEGHVVAWRSADPDIATVDETGRVSGLRTGRTLITAEAGDRSAAVEITVTEVPVASITVTPTGIVLEVGRTRQLTATVRDAAGNVLTDRIVAWTVDAPAVAAISGSGLLAGTGPGYATVIATSGGRSFAVAVTVSNGEADAMPYDLVYHRSPPGAVGEIMILATTGSAPPVRVNAGDVSRQPTVSPDGRRIAFYVSMRELGSNRQIDDIFAVDRTGMNMRQLTTEPGLDDQPAWSPRGDRIAYRRLDPATGRTSIWTMNSDGSGKVNLTADLEATLFVSEPAWSPDGSRIAFAVMRYDAGAQHSGIWSMDAAGGDRRQHTSSTTGYDTQPSWSPDGRRIAFVRAYGDETDITLLDLMAGETQRLPLPGRQWAPAWSPDGRHLAYWQPVGATGSTAIYTVRGDGSNVRLQTLDPTWGGGYDPVWARR